MAKNFKAWPKYWPKEQEYPEVTVHELLDSTASRVPNRIAIIFEGMELTYGELRELSCRFSSALDDMGIKKGDRVAIDLPNCPQFVIAYYGILRIGAVYTPISPLLSPGEVLHQLNDSGAVTLITLDLIFPGIQSIIPETSVKRVVMTSIVDCFNAISAPLKPLDKMDIPDTIDMVSLLKQYEPFDKQVAIDVKKDLAHIAYTGGTTGVSKGVMLTHANVVSGVLQSTHWFNGSHSEIIDGTLITVYPLESDPKDRHLDIDRETTLVVAPFFHAMGTIGYLNIPIFAGHTMVVFPRFEPKEYIEAVGKYKATILGGAPQLYIPLFNLPGFDDYDLSTVRLASSAAAPLPRVLMDRMLEAFPEGFVNESYGLTETTSAATLNPPSREGSRLGSVGIPVFDTEVIVTDLNTGEPLPPGTEGEICVKGPQVMQGYWNRPEATAEVLKDGWRKTGDIGWEDEDGYFYITDRLKDMIIYKGYNVYPRELEEILFKHPAVEQCAVVGKPDSLTGEIPVAFIKLRPGIGIAQEDLMAYVNEQVAAYKKIRDVILVDEMPVSGAGKVLKRALRQQFG